MDSIYELSQHANAQSYSPNRMCMSPTVPDVSILFEKSAGSSTRIQQRPDAHLSYNAWKSTKISHRNPETAPTSTTYRPSNVTNSTNDPSMQVSNSILRKQVRFRNHNLPQNIKNTVDHVFKCNEPLKNGRTDENKISDFENIYLANIPNRKLDLSIIEPPLLKETEVNSNWSKFAQLEKKLDAPVYDILNYKSPISNKSKELYSNCYYNNDYDCAQTARNNSEIKSDLGNYLTNKSKKNTFITESAGNLPFRPIFDNKDKESPMYRHFLNEQIPQLATETIVSTAALVPSNNLHNSDQPTVRDLLKIIQQQNEQLLILQKQVATLIDHQQTQRRPIENQQIPVNQPKLTNEPTFQVFDKDKFCPNNKNHILPNKFNIDVMTSFEVSIRPQQKPCGRPFDGCYQEAKIHEITEQFHNNVQLNEMMQHEINPTIDTSPIKGQTNELSLMLNEPLQVQEGRMSPDQSVHVDMHDYSSDSDCNSDDSPDLGWTIYNNVMGQVNNILTKANVARMNQMGTKPTSNNDKIKTRTMKKVKEATLRHLKSIGVHVPMDDSTDSLRTQSSKDELGYSPTEVSFAVQQLLMKYLPSEYLAKVANIPDNVQHNGIVPNVCKRNKNRPKANLVPRRPDFSFATVQYMKKYNLLASLDEESIQVSPPQKNIPLQHKFLDITALKQQPKLL